MMYCRRRYMYIMIIFPCIFLPSLIHLSAVSIIRLVKLESCLTALVAILGLNSECFMSVFGWTMELAVTKGSKQLEKSSLIMQTKICALDLLHRYSWRIGLSTYVPVHFHVISLSKHARFKAKHVNHNYLFTVTPG